MSSIAIDASDVTKVYRRYAHSKQFATLKSACSPAAWFAI